MPLAEVSHHDLLYRMQHIERIEIAEGRAVVWKQFRAAEPLTTGANTAFMRRAFIVCTKSRAAG